MNEMGFTFEKRHEGFKTAIQFSIESALRKLTYLFWILFPSPLLLTT